MFFFVQRAANLHCKGYEERRSGKNEDINAIIIKHPKKEGKVNGRKRCKM